MAPSRLVLIRSRQHSHYIEIRFQLPGTCRSLLLKYTLDREYFPEAHIRLMTYFADGIWNPDGVLHHTLDRPANNHPDGFCRITHSISFLFGKYILSSYFYSRDDFDRVTAVAGPGSVLAMSRLSDHSFLPIVCVCLLPLWLEIH